MASWAGGPFGPGAVKWHDPPTHWSSVVDRMVSARGGSSRVSGQAADGRRNPKQEKPET